MIIRVARRRVRRRRRVHSQGLFWKVSRNVFVFVVEGSVGLSRAKKSSKSSTNSATAITSIIVSNAEHLDLEHDHGSETVWNDKGEHEIDEVQARSHVETFYFRPQTMVHLQQM